MNWSLIIPVRSALTAKSRLDNRSAKLSRGIALDTILAASRTDGVHTVIVVTDDETLQQPLEVLVRATDARLHVVPQGQVEGLNPSIELGIEFAKAVQPDLHLGVLLGDLPALRPVDLQTALVRAERHPRAVVSDRTGTGTTLLTARASARLTPAFGDGSFARHLAGGHQAIELRASSSVRLDVDTRADLLSAEALGLGVHTRGALAAEHAASRNVGRARESVRGAA